ncbi:MAG: SDR family oxidoreductase [Halioglobus sp.]|nr:SDR family oxidoreductase [Halioglobus sp.]
MQGFHNTVVLITGAASGFGKLLAEKLSAAGARLVLGDSNAQGLQRLQEDLTGDVIVRSCDVTDETQVQGLVRAAVSDFGRLDIAINNAGISSPMKSLIDTTEADMDLNFAVNAKGVFFGMKHQLQAMLPQGEGCILNVASMAGIGGAPKLTAYCAAKHAVVGLTKTAAAEFARKNIRINAVCPYYSPTPLVTDSDLGGMQDFLSQGSPMKRLGTPEEIVSAMLLIIHPTNTYMTGQAVAVDGGVSAL